MKRVAVLLGFQGRVARILIPPPPRLHYTFRIDIIDVKKWSIVPDTLSTSSLRQCRYALLGKYSMCHHV